MRPTGIAAVLIVRLFFASRQAMARDVEDMSCRELRKQHGHSMVMTQQ